MQAKIYSKEPDVFCNIQLYEATLVPGHMNVHNQSKVWTRTDDLNVFSFILLTIEVAVSHQWRRTYQ